MIRFIPSILLLGLVALLVIGVFNGNLRIEQAFALGVLVTFGFLDLWGLADLFVKLRQTRAGSTRLDTDSERSDQG